MHAILAKYIQIRFNFIYNMYMHVYYALNYVIHFICLNALQ